MKDYVYHGSSKDNLKIIEPSISTHNKNCVYATPYPEFALLFMSDATDLDVRITSIDNKLTIIERKDNVLSTLYNKKGYLYTLDGSSFKHYDYLMSREVISFESVKVIKKEIIDNILDRLLEYERLGKLKIYHYPDRPSDMPLDNSDLIDQFINIEKNGRKGAIDFLLSKYPEFEKIIKEKIK